MTGGQLAVPVSGRLDVRNRGDIRLRLIPVLLCLPVLFMFEFSAFTAQTTSRLYSTDVGGGFRLIDVLNMGLTALQLMITRRTRLSIRFPTSLAFPLALATGAWAISLAYGKLTGGTHLMFDWRSIVLGVAISLITAAGVRSRRDSAIVLDTVLILSAAFSVFVLAAFAAGGGVRTGPTGRIPLWDQHALTVLSFSPVLAVARWLTQAPRRRLALLCSIPCFAVVVLSSRRNNWGELLCGLGLLLLLDGGVRRRFHALGLVAVLMAVVTVVLGPARLASRVESMDPNAYGTPESATNAGHVGDVLDAWDAVKTSPWLGIGQGKPYRTSRIVDWKTESWMVHNAPLHVWIRYGLLGLIAFFWWHAAYFRYLNRLRRRWRVFREDGARETSALLLATLCWSVGVFIVAMFFSEWSYTSLQRMTLIGTLWGLTLHRSVRRVPPVPGSIGVSTSRPAVGAVVTPLPPADIPAP